MTHLLVLGLCLPAFAALSLAIERHQEDVFGHTLPAGPARALRVAGWTLLLAALWCAVASYGWGFGLVAYSGHSSAAAGLVFIALLAWNRRKRQ